MPSTHNSFPKEYDAVRAAAADDLQHNDSSVNNSVHHHHHDDDDDDFADDDDPPHDFSSSSERRPLRRNLPTASSSLEQSPPTTTSSSRPVGMWFLLVAVLGVGLTVGLTSHKNNHANRRPTNNNNYPAPVSQQRQDRRPVIHYDASVLSTLLDPFGLTTTASQKSSLLVPPVLPWAVSEQPPLGYLMQPHVVNDTLVFISQGDLYWARLSSSSSSDNNRRIAAIKLTTTVGNVNSPCLHPKQPLVIAYTATYQSRRDVYLMDLRASAPAQRVTYWANSPYGVSAVVGWKDDTTLVVAAASTAVSLPDTRLYEISLATTTTTSSTKQQPSPPVVWQIQPIPLSQALNVAFSTPNDTGSSSSSSSDDDDDCLYFTRFRQGSHTARYVGGTAESLWAYCPGQTQAVPLTADYPGTSKHPTIWRDPSSREQAFLLFLSDRGSSTSQDDSSQKQPEPTSMNLWAMPLPRSADLYDTTTTTTTGQTSNNNNNNKPMRRRLMIQLTSISCQFNGQALQEYSLDDVTGRVVLRIGADLYSLSAADIQQRLAAASSRDDNNDRAVMTITPTKLPLQVLSDFHELQERLIPVDLTKHLAATGDVFDTSFGTTAMLLTLRGQVWVTPVLDRDNTGQSSVYQGAGQNLPQRRYRVIPGARTGGAMRVLKAVHVPLWTTSSSSNDDDDDDTDDGTRVALVLATDPASPTAEHAFYLVPIQSDSINAFTDLEHLPQPFLGGQAGGGSVANGGLGSVRQESVKVSPCGRRLAWTDKDGRICVMTLPLYKSTRSAQDDHQQQPSYHVLPVENEMGEPLNGDTASLVWSPGGRYLAVEHSARNQFSIISIVDCGNPTASKDDDTSLVRDVTIGRIVQATPDRFNSGSMYWGKSAMDIFLQLDLSILSKTSGTPEPDDVATTLFFLTDRDIITDVTSPWGTRAPSPHFPMNYLVYALPLSPKAVDGQEEDSSLGRFPGGGALEIFMDELSALEKKLKEVAKSAEKGKPDDGVTRRLAQALKDRRLTRHHVRSVQRYLRLTKEDANTTDEEAPSPFPKDIDIEFGGMDLTFARTAYRVASIPKARYVSIASQTMDDGSLILIARGDTGLTLNLFAARSFPSDEMEATRVVSKSLVDWGLSTSREHLYFLFAGTDSPRVASNTMKSLTEFLSDFTGSFDKNVASTRGMSLSVWPQLEYQQMYNDAWRMLRDYFYDKNMHGVDWPAIHERYKDLVSRCTKREELDDVLGQMASELSALHVFVYGGEYNSPFDGDESLISLHTPASLGANLIRTPEWKGYKITEIAERDPDFNLLDGSAAYSPLSDRALRPTGQRGLAVGDVIVGVNGESVMSVPDIHMLLRGMAGKSVRLQVLRLASGSAASDVETAIAEPLVTVPITPAEAARLRYNAWEWKTRKKARELAAAAGFTVGYIHMRDMVDDGENAFARNFFPDYDKQGLILDLRHNGGGSIDSWILDALQKKAWMFWGSRTGVRSGDIDWDEQFAFRGHLVVLIDENSGSDAEGVSRGISELGLGRLIGTRTWGGGIWLSSDNVLVDGGIATAPEIGTFNKNFDWGLGIEQQGVKPDVEVDNNPRTSFDGVDTQLERAIAELKQWLKDEPVVEPKAPGPKPNRAKPKEDCPA